MFLPVLANGLFLKATLQRETHQKIIVIESELEILFIALHFLDFSEDIESGRLKIFLDEDVDYPTIREYVGLNKIGQFLKTYIFCISLTLGKYRLGVMRTNKIFTEAIIHFIRSHGNDAIDSANRIDHFWTNVPKMLRNPRFYELTTKKK